MSVNYHAYQSRGVLFSEYEKVCAQWRETFAGLDPERLAKILHLKRDTEYLYIEYFQTLYRLGLGDGGLEKKGEDGWNSELYFNESMAVYHLLYYTKDLPVVSGKWVSSHSIDGVVSRNPNVPDPLLDPFARRYTGHTGELEEACRELGGEKIAQGDVGYEFEAFPCLHLRLVFWDADEDFPAQVQILVDQKVTDFLHYETVGCVISDLLEKLDARCALAETGADGAE